MQNYLKTMTILFRTQQSVLAYSMEDIKKYDLNFTEFSVLEVLFKKTTLSVQSICDVVLIANSSMTYVLDKLEKRGLIKRYKDKTDKRVILVKLTNKGQKITDEIIPKHYEYMHDLFKVLDVTENESLQTLLKKIGYYADEKVGN
ncbi:MAG: MarR family transcriptional regulator [Acholeplasmataceae bacterium]|nr:MarR family transcriptional regulator [Acholeplasmataceae bacterium]